MTNLSTSSPRRRISAVLIAACIVSVWLLGAGAALSSSIYSTKHACCHQQKLADACLTLCTSANWSATASVEQSPTATVLSVASTEAVRPISVPSGVFVQVSAVIHSPPLYLQHSSLLI